jgi:hypothetical protein
MRRSSTLIERSMDGSRAGRTGAVQAPEEQLLCGPVPPAEGPARPAEGAVAASILTAVYHMLNNGTFHRSSRISAPTTSIAARPKPKPGVWSPNSPGLASRCNSNRSPKPPVGPAKLSPERSPDRRNPSLAYGRFLVSLGSEVTRQIRKLSPPGSRLLRSANKNGSIVCCRKPHCRYISSRAGRPAGVNAQ